MPKTQGRRKQWSGVNSPVRKKNYSEPRTKQDERPKKRNRQKMTHKMRGRRREGPRTNSLTWKRLERRPKSEKKPAKPPRTNQVSAPACDRGSGVSRPIPKISLVPRHRDRPPSCSARMRREGLR